MRKIGFVCFECGVTARVLTHLKNKKTVPNELYLTEQTYHNGKCDYCLKEKPVSHRRTLLSPNFELIAKGKKRIG